MRNVELTVAVCVKDDGRIKRLLTSLSRQTVDPSRFEVVVVTTGEDKFQECVDEYADLNVRLFHSSVARHSVQRNIALDQTRGPLFLSTDADCVASPTWIEDMLRAFTDAPASVVGIGGRIVKFNPVTLV